MPHHNREKFNLKFNLRLFEFISNIFSILWKLFHIFNNRLIINTADGKMCGNVFTNGFCIEIHSSLRSETKI